MLSPLARLILHIGGWTSFGGHPEIPKALIIAAPHTSNWDGFWALVYKVAIRTEIRFFAKHSLFWFPLGTLLRALGGIPLDRSKAGSAVVEAVRMFKENDSFYFGLAPEGTRSLMPGWKSGFYRIASDANVPIIPGYLNFRDKRIGLGEPFALSGDIDADMLHIAGLYDATTARWPEKASPVQLREPRKRPS